MRCLYRERRYICGNYMEVDLFPVFAKQKGRGRKAKPTSEVQARLNEHNAEELLVRLLNANFTPDDIEIHLTYADREYPKSDNEMRRDVQNFIRRVKRFRKARKLDEMKYVVVPQGEEGGTRFHFHVTMTGGIDRDELEKLWGFGYANSKRLQFSENGIEGLARYVAKQFREKKKTALFKKRWIASKNLEHPKPKDRDGRLSARKVKDIATVDSENLAAISQMYDGYVCTEIRPFYNEVNTGYYLHFKLYKYGTSFQNMKRRKPERIKDDG